MQLIDKQFWLQTYFYFTFFLKRGLYLCVGFHWQNIKWLGSLAQSKHSQHVWSKYRVSWHLRFFRFLLFMTEPSSGTFCDCLTDKYVHICRNSCQNITQICMKVGNENIMRWYASVCMHERKGTCKVSIIL